MAQIPTDEEVGMKILKIFGEFSVRPGEILKLGSITSKIESYGCRVEDIQCGCQWLLDNGHIEQRNDRSDNLFLTESGFSLI
jgi:hypothetical protein